MGRNCVVLVARVCGEDLPRLPRLLQWVLRRAGVGGLVKVMVYLCNDVDFREYVRRLNEVVANNFTTSMILYEYGSLEDVVKDVDRDLVNCGNKVILSTLDLPGLVYERVTLGEGDLLPALKG